MMSRPRTLFCDSCHRSTPRAAIRCIWCGERPAMPVMDDSPADNDNQGAVPTGEDLTAARPR